VHPDDIASVEAEQALLFERDRHTAEYRFRKKDGHYCWVSDEQHLIRDEKGQPFEIVGARSLRRACERRYRNSRGKRRLDLQKRDRTEIVAALEAIIARLKGSS
jgi:PAS domain-containing protein